MNSIGSLCLGCCFILLGINRVLTIKRNTLSLYEAVRFINMVKNNIRFSSMNYDDLIECGKKEKFSFINFSNGVSLSEYASEKARREFMGFVNKIGIGKNRFKELRRSRLCGYILLTVNLALSGAVLMILYQNKGHHYGGILIYVMALYTFYITTIAIVNLIKYKKRKSPVMSMTKIISMAAALVSMLSLETAMFSQFGKEMSQWGQRLMIILTGAGVSAVIITMSLYSIIKNTKELKKQYEQ